MDIYNFVTAGKTYVAQDAGWEKNGERVWDIFNEDDVLLDSITVHPYSDISAEAALWAEMELCYA